jgi:integrase
MSFLSLSNITGSKRRRTEQRLTLNAFFDQHYFPHAKVSKAQPHHDYSVFNTHLRQTMGTRYLDEMTNPVLDVWVREQVVSGLKRSTINKHINMLNRMLILARHWGHIPYDSTQHSPIKPLQLGDYRQRFLSQEEIERLMRACRASTHPFLLHFVQLLLLTGARKGEALGAVWRDIDFVKRVWTVPKSKNGRSRRIVLNNAAVAVLHDTRAQAERLMLSVQPTAPVFTNPKTRKAYKSFYLSWYLTRSLADLDDVRIHDLRHTYASLLINKGVSLYEVQKLLGHSSVQMTQRYAHLSADVLHSRAELVGDVVNAADKRVEILAQPVE